MLKRKSYVWTSADETGLKQMAEKGAHVRAIALRLRRPESSVKKKARDMGIKVKLNPYYRANDLGRAESDFK